MLSAIIFNLLYIHTTTAQLQQSTTVNALTQPLNGISITYNPETTKTFGTSYNTTVQSQNAYDISISLDTTWSFKPTVPTTLILTLNGHTPNPTSDSDFIIVFTVDNKEYFSFFIHLDTTTVRSKIYPSQKLAHESNILSYLNDSITYPQRWDRVSNGNQWITTKPRYNTRSQWPLQFHITNNISSNNILFSYYDKATIYETGNTFNDTFTPNTPINIYIMGDTSREQFYIHDINIQLYHDNIPTISPTNIPTISPTNTPTTNIPTTNIPTTNIPTTNIPTTILQTINISPTTHIPSIYPSINPSIYPTLFPSNIPSISPSNIPTGNPIQNPTKNPTIFPSNNPTENPSYIPTILPSFFPTKIPTNIPTNSPTYNPSYTPTNTPTISPTYIPTNNPTFQPSITPTKYPTISPTFLPSISPSKISLSPITATPTESPTNIPSILPTNIPSLSPSIPTISPTKFPTIEPTINPTYYPTHEPIYESTYIVTDNILIKEYISEPSDTFDITSYVIIIILFISVAFCAVIILLIVAKNNQKKNDNKIEKDNTLQGIVMTPKINNRKNNNHDSYEKVDTASPAFQSRPFPYNYQRPPMPYITHDIGHGSSVINDGIIIEEILDENNNENNNNINDYRAKQINLFYTGHDSNTTTMTTGSTVDIPIMKNNMETKYNSEEDDDDDDDDDDDETTVSNQNRYIHAAIGIRQDGIYEETETKLTDDEEEETKYTTTDDGYADRTMPNPFKKNSKLSESGTYSKSHNHSPKYVKKFEVNNEYQRITIKRNYNNNNNNNNNNNDNNNDIIKKENSFSSGNKHYNQKILIKRNNNNSNRKRINTESYYSNSEYIDKDVHGTYSSSDDSYHNRMQEYDFVEDLQVLHEHDMNIKNVNNNSNNIHNVIKYKIDSIKKDENSKLKNDLSLKVLPPNSEQYHGEY